MNASTKKSGPKNPKNPTSSEEISIEPTVELETFAKAYSQAPEERQARSGDSVKIGVLRGIYTVYL